METCFETVRVAPKTIEPIRKTVGPVQKTVEPIRKAVELFPKQFNGSRKRFNGLEHSSMLCSSTVCITFPRFSLRSFPHRNVPKSTVETLKYCAKAHFSPAALRAKKQAKNKIVSMKTRPKGAKKMVP